MASCPATSPSGERPLKLAGRAAGSRLERALTSGTIGLDVSIPARSSAPASAFWFGVSAIASNEPATCTAVSTRVPPTMSGDRVVKLPGASTESGSPLMPPAASMKSYCWPTSILAPPSLCRMIVPPLRVAVPPTISWV